MKNFENEWIPEKEKDYKKTKDDIAPEKAPGGSISESDILKLFIIIFAGFLFLLGLIELFGGF